MLSETTKNNIIASSIGAISAELLTIPICTLRTNYQTKIDHTLSTWGYVRNIYARKGIKSFYNATWASSCSQVASLAIKYTAYEKIKKIRNSSDNIFLDNCVNSIASSWIASIFHHPFDVARVHIQRDDTIREQINKKGIFNTFKEGYSKTLIRNTLTSIIFPLHDMYKDLLKSYHIDDKYKITLAPILTSITSTISLYPLDYIRNRQMSGLNWRHGFNIFCYYRGVNIALFRNVLHFTTFCMIAENVKRNFLK